MVEYNEKDPLNRLIDSVIKTNQDNVTVLNSLSESLYKISEAKLTIEDMQKEVQTISTTMKIIMAITTVIFAACLTIFGLYQTNLKNNIVSDISIKMEKIIEDNNNKCMQRR
jgi:hypothetical protein